MWIEHNSRKKNVESNVARIFKRSKYLPQETTKNFLDQLTDYLLETKTSNHI